MLTSFFKFLTFCPVLRVRGHGTHVAGTIGAVGDNGIGVIGVSPNVSIMPLKLVDRKGEGFFRNAARAIRYAVANGARVLNGSFGGAAPNFWADLVNTSEASQFSAMSDAISSAGGAEVLFVAAAGNDKKDIDDYDERQFPAGFSLAQNVVTVAATDSNDNLADFSNTGSLFVNIAAPGVNIYSTVPSSVHPSGYLYLNGTSMAAPHVAGAAALLLAQQPILTAKELKDTLLSTGDLIPALQGKVGRQVGGRRLNVYRALETLLPKPDVPPLRRVQLIIHRVRDIDYIDNEGDIRFYPEVTIAGEVLGRRAGTLQRNPAYAPINTVGDADGDIWSITPQWKFTKDVGEASQVGISVEIWHDDNDIGDSSDLGDISQVAGESREQARRLNITYDLLTNQLVDQISGITYTRDENGQFYTVGNDEDDNKRVAMWFSIVDTV